MRESGPMRSPTTRPRSLGESALNEDTRIVHVVSAGYAALEVVRGSGDVIGTVHSAFRRVFNVLTPNRRFVSVATAGVSEAPNVLVTDAPEEPGWSILGLTPGDSVARNGEELSLHEGSLRIRLQGASTFLPAIRGPATPLSPRIPAMIEAAARCALGCGPRSGFHPLLAFVDRLFEQGAGEPPLDDVFCGRGYIEMAALVRGIMRREPALIETAVRGLVGLGPGLTPSGDDALCGLMLALALTTSALGCPEVALREINPLVLAETRGRTTELSEEFLRFAAMGEGSAVAEELVAGILSGREDSVVSSTCRLLQSGASSGVDQLWGILVGIELGLRLALPKATGKAPDKATGKANEPRS